MISIQEQIIVMMNNNSSRGKKKVAPIDLGKKLDLSQRKFRREIRSLIEKQKLAYWTSGSGSYIMLKKDYDLQSEIEEMKVKK